MSEGVKTYCLGADWFENERAPYPVYSVATGELVCAAADESDESSEVHA